MTRDDREALFLAALLGLAVGLAGLAAYSTYPWVDFYPSARKAAP